MIVRELVPKFQKRKVWELARSISLPLILLLWSWFTVQPSVGQETPIRADYIVVLYGWRVLPWAALFWLGVFLFSWAWSREKHIRVPPLRIFRMGFLLHTGLLLGSYIDSLGMGTAPLESLVQRAYAYLFSILTAGGISLWAFSQPLRPVDRDAFETPLLAVYPYMLLVLLRSGAWIWASSSVLIVVACYGVTRWLKQNNKLKRSPLNQTQFQIVWGIAFAALSTYFLYRYTLGLTWFPAHEWYLQWARSFLQGKPILAGDAYGYWISLALFFKIFGENIPLFFVFQYFLAGVAAWASYWMTRRMAGEMTSRWTALLFLVNYTLSYLAVFVHWATFVFVYFTFVVASLLKAHSSTGKSRSAWLALSAVFLGLLISVRIENAIFVPLIVGWLLRDKSSREYLLRVEKKTHRSAHRFKAAGGYLVVMFLAMAPFSYVNYQNMGTPYPVTTQKGRVINAYTLTYHWSTMYRYVFPRCEQHPFPNNDDYDLLIACENPFENPRQAWAAFKKAPFRIIGRFFTEGGHESLPPANNLWKRFVMGAPILFSASRWQYMHLLFLEHHSRWFFYLCFYSFAFFLLGLILVFRAKQRHPFWAFLLLLIGARYMMQVLLALHWEGAERYTMPFFPLVLPFLAVAIGALVTTQKPETFPSRIEA